MMQSKIAAVFVSALCLSLGGWLLVAAAAESEPAQRVARTALLDSNARHIEAHIQAQGAGLAAAAETIASADTLAADVRMLSNTINFIKPGAKPNPAQQNRLDQLGTKLSDAANAGRERLGKLGGITLINEVGVVLSSDSEVFQKGQSLIPAGALPTPPPRGPGAGGAPTPDETPEGDGTEPAEAAAPAPEGATPEAKAADIAWLVQAMTGQPSEQALLSDGLIYFVGAAPIRLKDKVVGAAIVERRLQDLPNVVGVEAVILSGTTVVLGTMPDKVDIAGLAEEPRLVAARPIVATLAMFGEMAYEPSVAPAQHAGLWGRRFNVAGLADASGYVFIDLSSLYNDLASRELRVVLVVLVGWLVHAVAFLLIGLATARGITRMADFLGRLLQGAGEERRLRDTRFPRNLRRLVRLLNQAVEKINPAEALATLPKAPSVDDVLQAQKVDNQVPDPADLEFEGITNSGNLNLKNLPDRAVSLGSTRDAFSGSLADLKDTVENDQPTGDLPSAGDAAGALAGLADLDDVAGTPLRPGKPAAKSAGRPAPPPPPPPGLDDELANTVLGADAGDVGPAADNMDSVVTGTMAPNPDLLAQLRDIGLPVTAPGDVAPSKAAPPKPPPPSVEDADNGATAVMKMTPEMLARMTAEQEPAKPPPGPPPRPPLREAATVVAKVPPELLAQSRAAAPPAPPAAGNVSAEQDKHYREVFTEFVSTRKTCGEVGDLSYDKFVQRLIDTRTSVINKHSCRDVRFQVYVKDNKAALKATPVR